MTIHAFFRRYADAFLNQDAGFISSVYAFPMVFFTETGETVSFDQDTFTENSHKLIANYQSIGVNQVAFDMVSEHVLSDGLTMVSVLWSFRDEQGQELYHATVRYMLQCLQKTPKISAVVVVDEMTNFRALLAKKESM